MFTGIIQNRGRVERLEKHEGGARIEITAALDPPLAAGESLAVNGVCLTAIESGRSLVADLSNETLRLTTLGSIAPGVTVNLERALRAEDRLSGHLVQGHVDAVGTLISIERDGSFAIFRWSYPPEFGDLIVSKGSIAVDGISLTVVDPDETSFGAALIPETLERTSLGESRVGEMVNLELDVIAKYVRRMIKPYLSGIGE